MDTLTGNELEGNAVSSFNHEMLKGGSPRLTPHTARVRVPSGNPSLGNEKGSIIGGTGRIKEIKKIHESKKEKKRRKIEYDSSSVVYR